MSAQAVAERIEVPASLAEQMQPSTQLTPMQMAYQLMSKGAEFAAVKEMMDYGKQLEADAAEKAFNIAMAEAQKEMVVVVTNMTNSQTKSRYADYAQIDKALRPIYTKHGFALSFNDGDSPRDEWVRILCHVTNSGHTRIYHKDMPADGKGARGNDVMTKTHAVGAAQQYAMRYLLRMIFNVAVGEADTDGNTPAETITEEQRSDLIDLMEQVGFTEADDARLMKVFKVQYLADLPAKDYARAVELVKAKQP